MPLINRIAEVEPERAYATASRKEMQNRLDHSLGVIERRLSSRISRFENAKASLSEIRLKTTEAHSQLNEWRLAHQGVRRLPERMPERVRDDGAYPWAKNVTARSYRKRVNSRFSKHRNVLRSSIDDLRAYVDQFNDRYAFIQKGFSWLKINPPKVNLISEVQAAFADLFATEVIDGVQRLVLKDAEILEAGEIVRRDIVSSDSDEMVVTKPNELVAVRKAAGIEVRNKMVADGALVGDGVDNADFYGLVAKMAEPDFMDAAIRLHFYKSGINPDHSDFYSDDMPMTLSVDLDKFNRNRDVATNYWMNRSNVISLDSRRVAYASDGGISDKYLVRSAAYPQRYDEAPVKIFPDSPKVKRSPLPLDSRAVSNKGSNSVKFDIRRGQGLPHLSEAYGDVFRTLTTGSPVVLAGGPGSGKTTMISLLMSSFTYSGATVKVIGGGGSLDVIENNLRRAMAKKEIGIDVSIDRFDDYMIVKRREGAPVRRTSSFERDGHHITVIDEASLVEMRDEFLDPEVALLVVGDIFQISKEGSVLDWAERSGIPKVILMRNYRAQNADLMAWSSIFRYDSAVQTIAHGKRLSGVRYVPMAKKINGVVMAEVRAVSNAAIAAMDQGGSAAVVAFSKKQLLAILDCMGTEQSARLKFAGLPVDIQGKEADHVFISIGAALTAGGKTPTRINGLEDEMGIARMNVALSRALYSNTIFSGLIESDIDLRVATGSQAIVLSVLKLHELLPSEEIISSDPFMNIDSFDQ